MHKKGHPCGGIISGGLASDVTCEVKPQAFADLLQLLFDWEHMYVAFQFGDNGDNSRIDDVTISETNISTV